MKLKNIWIYLAIFLLMGGYYYYFEVVKKEQEQSLERERKKLVRVAPENVVGLEILAKDKKRLVVEKEENWRITEPIKGDVDSGAFQDYLNTLSKVDYEREIHPTPEDLKAYGLQDPLLRVRWRVGENWSELQLGEKNPSGDAHYAKLGDKPGIYLVSAGVWSVLNRNLDELRKRELLSFASKDARALEILWHGGSPLKVEVSGDGESWKSADHPEMKIKKSKIENVLEQLSWLRARSFLENEALELKKHGLDPPHAIVNVQLKNGKSLQVRLSNEQKEQKTVAAVSSHLPGVVQIDGSILKELPKDVGMLEDRSLLSIRREEVQQIRCRLGREEIVLSQKGDNQWVYRKSGGKEEALKEVWPVRSLLWNLADAEYERKLDPGLPVPETFHGRLEIGAGESQSWAFSWPEHSDKDTGSVTLWMEQAGMRLPLLVAGQVLSKLEEDLSRLMKPEAIAKGKE
ncbi:MAG: DUF4340 domain-containing protein [Deltaproteobacteria bacterium]|nr:DUF4340 domain-containing protein [Deltaproteobacteria bacterium]